MFYEDNLKALESLSLRIQGLSKEVYCWKPTHLEMDPIGSHVRHTLDHYDCFFKGVSVRRINYNKRKRCFSIETEPEEAVSLIEIFCGKLRELSTDDLSTTLYVNIDTGERSDWTETSLMRELQFLIMHQVHHDALIRILLESQKIAVRPDFGIAPATLKYRTTSF